MTFHRVVNNSVRKAGQDHILEGINHTKNVKSFSNSGLQTWMLIKISCGNCYIYRLLNLFPELTESETPWGKQF